MVELRPFQKAALNALENTKSEKNHVLCVAPTGSGKSLIYENAASRAKRKTILVTPLVALARQQYETLLSLGTQVILGAGSHSKTIPNEKTQVWIISPEMLTFRSHQERLRNWKPNLLVVDECHCLWEWGENFRPAFYLIPNLISDLSITRSLWLTATMPYEARINLRVQIPKTLIEIGEFELPPRLHLHIKKTEWKNRSQVLISWIAKSQDAGIVFVPTREACLRLFRLLQSIGKKAIYYHGGMSSDERKNIEQQIKNNIPEVIVATSAFGMGMDYQQLRYVVLWQAPTSLLSLVQAIGRVGRATGSDGYALVLWDPEDIRMLEWTTQNSEKRIQELQDLFLFLSTPKCRRAGLRWYFDRIESNENCGLCDYCASTRH